MRAKEIIWFGAVLLISLGIGAGCEGVAPAPHPAEVATLRVAHRAVTSVAFSSDGKYLAAGSDDQTIKIWRVDDWHKLATLKFVGNKGNQSGVKSVAFSPDSNFLAAGGYKKIKVWRMSDWRKMIVLKGHVDLVRSVVFSPDGKYLASGSADNTIRVWGVQDWRELGTLKGHGAVVYSVAFSSDGKNLASGSRDNTIRVWKVRDWQELATLSEHGSVVFSPEGKYLASGGHWSINIWRVEDWHKLATLDSIDRTGGLNAVNSVAFSPDGKYLASGSTDQTIKIWRVEDWHKLATLDSMDRTGDLYAVNSVAFSHDGKYLASGSLGGTIKIWNKDAAIKPFLLAEAETARLARAEAEKQALPSALVITGLQFQDNNSACYHDKILNAGEEANIEFTLKNEGKGIGFDIVLDIDNDSPKINAFGFEKKLGDIQPAETKKITIPIKAGLDLIDGETNFFIQANEKRGYHSQKVKLALQTSALIPPELEIQSVEINDGKYGLAKGNGNGIPENNETVELIAYIKNSGAGAALGVSLDLATINPGLQVVKRNAALGVIHPEQTVKGKLVFSIPRTFESNQLQYQLKVQDVRGADTQTRQFAANFRGLSPALSYSHYIYDGNSANSKGNKNGIIENGETIGIEIIAQNTGDIEASGVEISLNAPRGLTLNKNSLTVGDIPAKAKGEKKTFILAIPRTYQKDKINLDLHITQSEFPSLNQPLELEVNSISPRITFTHRIIGNIQQGQRAELEVVVRNEGKLDAGGVNVSVDTMLKGIDLRKKEEVLGRLPAGAATDPMRFSFLVMRSAPVGQLPIQVTITQADFSSLTDTLAFNIREEGVAEVVVKGEKLLPARPHVVSAANFPPKIIVDSPFDGERLTTPEATLRFRVSDDEQISKVDILVNGVKYKRGIGGIALQPKQEDDRRQFKDRKNIALIEGDNTIQIIAYDNRNERAEEIVTVHYTKELEISRTFAIIIGIADYEHNGISDLKYTENDALEVKNFLMSKEGGGVARARIKLLLGKEATTANIRSAVGDWLPVAASRRNDRVVLFFAGHGVKRRNNGYFLAYNTDPEKIVGTSVKMRDITDYLYDVEAKTVIFFSDACHSGAAFDQKLASRGDRMDGDFLINQFSGKGYITMVAAKSGQESIEVPEYEHGLFTYYLLKGLKGAADSKGNGDRKVDIHELYQYIYEKVTDEAAKLNFSQNPKIDSQVEGDIIMAIVP